MKERKDCQLKVRLTKTEKERVMAYCEKYDMTVSDFIRKAVDSYLREKGA